MSTIVDVRRLKVKGNEVKLENHGKPLETHTRESVTGPKTF